MKIPPQLQKEEFRFVKIEKGKKYPFEKRWQKDANYSYKEIKKWDENYGVVCGYGGLVVIDCDKEKVEKTVKENLPETFKVRTGSGGSHSYFICKDLKKPIRMIEEKMGDLGDVQYTGKQVVGPGSIHPNGEKYKVVEDREIKEVSAEEIRFALKEFIKTTAEEVLEEEIEQSGGNFDISIKDVVSTGSLRKRNNEYQGSHPIHGSKTGQNFCINPSKNVWHCFRHDTGGGPLSWIAVKEGIIKCFDATKGCLKGGKFKKILKIAKNKYNLKTTRSTPKTGSSTKVPNLGNRDFGPYGTGSVNSLVQRKDSIYIDNFELPVPTVLEKHEKKEVWMKIKKTFENSNIKNKKCRYLTGRWLEKLYNFVTHPKTETLYVFDDNRYKPTGRQLIRKKVRRNLGSDVSDHDVNEIISIVRDENYVDLEEFQVDNLIVPTKNQDLKINNEGVLEKLDIDPERIIMSRIPWEYDSEADCPKIKKFLSEILNEEWIPTIQEMVGLCLANKKLTRKAFMLYGDGSNGKDILLDIIENLLGKENISNHTLHYLEYNRFAAASLVGKLANISGDLSEKELNSTSLFKRITGGSSIEVEEKGKNPFKYKSYATLVFAANRTPSFKEDTYALYDRWIIITFPYRFTSDSDDGNKDKVPKKEMLDMLRTEEEMKGFLNWAIEGLRRVMRNDGVITNQQPPEEIKEVWQKRSDSITAFAKNILESDPEEIISKRKLYEIYRDWCVDNSYPPKSMQTVGKKLPTKSPASKGQARIDGRKTKVWKGIKVKEEKPASVKDVILNVLGEKLLSYFELEKRLLDKGFDEDQIQDSIDYLETRGEIHRPRPGFIKKL